MRQQPGSYCPFDSQTLTLCNQEGQTADLIVDLQIGGSDKELALSSIPVIFNVHEDILNGTGDYAPAGPRVGPFHSERLAGACLSVCYNSCIVTLQRRTDAYRDPFRGRAEKVFTMLNMLPVSV